MTEKLEGSNWDSVQTLIDGAGNVYAFKFKKAGSEIYFYRIWTKDTFQTRKLLLLK